MDNVENLFLDTWLKPSHIAENVEDDVTEYWSDNGPDASITGYNVKTKGSIEVSYNVDYELLNSFISDVLPSYTDTQVSSLEQVFTVLYPQDSQELKELVTSLVDSNKIIDKNEYPNVTFEPITSNKVTYTVSSSSPTSCTIKFVLE